MPELPEVHTFQRYFERTSLHQRIVAVQVHDDKIIRNMLGADFAERLTNRTFVGAYRQGKYLFGDLDNGHSVLLHFGMTGDLRYYCEETDRPRFERFALHFDNGFRLGFDDPRKFANIRYLENRHDYLNAIGLGKDALYLTETEFLTLTAGKKGNLKSFLLNQHYIAGIGNLYADEICYQTRVHPASAVGKIPEEQRCAIFQTMQQVLQFAIEREAYYKDYPEDWLWQWRTSGATAPNGSPIQSAKIAGRTTYFFPGWQQLY